jgi:hypothetical protein
LKSPRVKAIPFSMVSYDPWIIVKSYLNPCEDTKRSVP